MHYSRDPLLSNLAYKRAFLKYGRKMVLASASHTHSSLQFVPLGMIIKVQTWFFKVQNYSETSDCLFLQEKPCKNVHAVLKYRDKSTP